MSATSGAGLVGSNSLNDRPKVRQPSQEQQRKNCQTTAARRLMNRALIDVTSRLAVADQLAKRAWDDVFSRHRAASHHRALVCDLQSLPYAPSLRNPPASGIQSFQPVLGFREGHSAV